MPIQPGDAAAEVRSLEQKATKETKLMAVVQHLLCGLRALLFNRFGTEGREGREEIAR